MTVTTLPTRRRTRRPPDPRLVPIVKTAFYPTFRTGRRECWGARTTDGEWTFSREESAGTPWLVYHEPSVKDESHTTPVLYCHTLRACRIGVGSGYAAKVLAAIKCDHPKGQRGIRPGDGYTFVICGACQARRVVHTANCSTCLADEAHEWNAVL